MTNLKVRLLLPSLLKSSAYVGCFSGEHLSATLNDKISERDYEAGRFLDTDELPEYNVSFDKKRLVDLVSAFNGFDSDVKDFSDNLDIKAKSETKRKTLSVPFEVDADKQSTDDDDFDK